VKESLKAFYGNWASVFFMYVLALGLLVTGWVTRACWPLGVAIGVFTIWDLLWAASSPDRTAQETLDSATRARTYMSYFVAVYGVALGFFFVRLAAGDQKEIIRLVTNAGVPPMLLLMPFALQSTAMLFFPVKLGGDATGVPNAIGLAGKYPTSANLAVLVINVWVEKVSTFTFVYLVAVLVSSFSA